MLTYMQSAPQAFRKPFTIAGALSLVFSLYAIPSAELFHAVSAQAHYLAARIRLDEQVLSHAS